jgi:hypothetical protein
MSLSCILGGSSPNDFSMMTVITGSTWRNDGLGQTQRTKIAGPKGSRPLSPRRSRKEPFRGSRQAEEQCCRVTADLERQA